jgi:lysophospholipase L1-like esterase
MMKLRPLLSIALLAGTALAQDHAAVQPAHRGGKQHARHLAINERIAQGKVDLLFVGDSITQGWEGRGAAVWREFYGGRRAVNLGIGGDRTQHVLWRLENGNVDGIAPRVAVVMIGTNNSNREDHTATEIAEGVTAIVRSLRSKLPHTQVLLLDIFPRGVQPNAQRGKLLQVNQVLQHLDDEVGVYTLSIGHRFLEADGSISKAIMPDALHLSEEGYLRWATAIEPTLARLLAADPPSVAHSVLVAGRHIPTRILGEDGEVLWSHPAPSSDAVVLDGGNVLMALYPHGEYPGGGVLEVTRDGEVVFDWKATQNEVSTAQLTAEGRILVNESGPNPRLLELDRAGQIVHEVPLACQHENFHMQTRMARKLPNGNYLAPHLLDFAVKEYDPSGAVVRSFETDQRGREHRDWPFTAIRLVGGNTLIGCTNGNRVIEVDGAGAIVWELSNADLASPLIDDACGVQRLPNGNTVVTSYHAGPAAVHLFEVTRDKHVVWEWAPDCAGVHHFQVLTTNGRPVPGPALR